MTEHLRHEELIDALDDALEASRQGHLDACQACEAQLFDLREMLREAHEVEIPAPSPLYWDHFSDRVRQATAQEPVPSGSDWWRAWWRPVGALVTVVGAVALVVILRPSPPPSAVEDTVPVANLSFASDDGSWGLVIGLASELDWSDVREAARPADGTADAMIDELTAAQRGALAKLLQEGIGEPQ